MVQLRLSLASLALSAQCCLPGQTGQSFLLELSLLREHFPRDELETMASMSVSNGLALWEERGVASALSRAAGRGQRVEALERLVFSGVVTVVSCAGSKMEGNWIFSFMAGIFVVVEEETKRKGVERRREKRRQTRCGWGLV